MTNSNKCALLPLISEREQSNEQTSKQLRLLFPVPVLPVMGRTVHMISVECSSSKDSLTSATVKKSMKYFNVPDTEQWRVGVLSELLSETLEIPGFASQEIEDIKSYICTS